MVCGYIHCLLFNEAFLNYSELESEDDLVTIRMLSLPDMRFLRNTVKTEMDLFSEYPTIQINLNSNFIEACFFFIAVSLGGLMGLFFGISLLTVFYAMSLVVRGCSSRKLKIKTTSSS